MKLHYEGGMYANESTMIRIRITRTLRMRKYAKILEKKKCQLH